MVPETHIWFGVTKVKMASESLFSGVSKGSDSENILSKLVDISLMATGNNIYVQ